MATTMASEASPLASWSILYRGPLSSCNYTCDYCPFAKTKNTRQELAEDAQKLARFVDWVGQQSQSSIGILFTPWGEALIRRHYQEAMVTLSQMAHVRRVAIQTNLSCELEWLEQAAKDRIALWTTYHPSQLPFEAFLAKSHELVDRGIRHSVGVVGLKEHMEEIARLRQRLHPQVYLWINAYKRISDYYTQSEQQALQQIDPLFAYNVQRHESFGHLCRAGASAFSVDGEGNARRCHFLPTVIGNIYEPDFASSLREEPCSNATCGCYIGYVHLDRLGLYETYKDGVLERVLPNFRHHRAGNADKWEEAEL